MAFTEFHYYSETLEIDVSVNVILPETRIMAQQEGKPLPTLYLLHGLSDDHTHWVRQTRLEFYARKYRLAIIMPCVNRSFYTDMKRGAKYFTFVSEELPRVMEMYFPLSSRREDRFAAGLSMGGYGALKCALRAPETYCAAASLSGAVDVSALTLEKPAGERGYWEDVFGPAQAIAGSENDLFAVSERLAASGKALPKLYMWCGTEDGLYGQNVRLRDHLRAKGYDLTYEESPGDHQWKYWDEKIQTVLSWLPISKAAKN